MTHYLKGQEGQAFYAALEFAAVTNSPSSCLIGGDYSLSKPMVWM